MGRLVDRLVEALGQRGVRFETLAVSRIIGEKGGAVMVEPFGAFDAAVVATPAGVATDLVLDSAPDASDELRGIRSASVVLATFAYRRSEIAVPDGTSGILVAAGEGRLMTACSFGSAKWPHWSDRDTMVLRVSAGRAGDERALQLPDDDLVDQLQRDVAGALGTTASPFHWRVSRWREAFPQYEVGHRTRVERIEAALRRDLPGVALAGASLRGSGIPACIASGRQAARSLRGRGSGT
jgi:oxygen-dependent protoporphyrinogen oxidase